jgi:hypothetical protein
MQLGIMTFPVDGMSEQQMPKKNSSVVTGAGKI